MTKVFQIIIVAIALTSTAYSQTVKSSFFSMDQVQTSPKNNIVRTINTKELVVSSFDSELMQETLTFLKDSEPLTYVALPSNYRIKDMEVFEDRVYFCGVNTARNCGYVGMIDAPTGGQALGGFNFINIDSTKTLTKLVVFKAYQQSTAEVVAVGTPQNTSYKSCVVDLNNINLSTNSWEYKVALTNDEEIFDVAVVSDDIVVTVGKEYQSSSGNSGILVTIPNFTLRLYKRNLVIGTGIENIMHKYSTGIYSVTSDNLRLQKIDVNTVAVVGIFGPVNTISNSATVFTRIIDVNYMNVTKLQSVNIGLPTGNLQELEFFAKSNTLATVLNRTTDVGEVLFTNIGKTSDYSSFKIWKDGCSFGSMTHYGNNFFAISCAENNSVYPQLLSILQEGLNYYENSQCSSNETIQVTASSSNSQPTVMDKAFQVIRNDVKASFEPAPLYQTNVTVHCVNYYKQ